MTSDLWPLPVGPLTLCAPPSWVSVLQNSREEALTEAFQGVQNEGENNIVQELTRAIVEEVKRMSGNHGCCDCGAPGTCSVLVLEYECKH